MKKIALVTGANRGIGFLPRPQAGSLVGMKLFGL